ncbi:LOW QUALITY PROTEIN: hypothetical protein Cgig2_023739 [Carnegiea gigantea]|uniref:Uncharacterized protein n=1 Tax=Carnegiea gigantea TaxID=171969 RepID=A0A9Q1JVM6_9CARY|nr:LOW QUALITY PROTEIN: hypothetical protein Cgig2_023739 [Carnegiea gigantea]
MPKSSGYGRVKTFDLTEALELIGFLLEFCYKLSDQKTLINNGQLSWVNFTYFASIRSSYICYYCKDTLLPYRFNRQFDLHEDIPTDIDFSTVLSSKIMLQLHQACVSYGTNSRVLFPSTHSGGNSKRKRYSSSDQNIQRDEGPSGSRLKLKPLGSPVLETEDNTPQAKIPGYRRKLNSIMDFLGNDLCLNNSKSIYTPSDDDEVESTPKANAYECPLHKMLLSSTLMSEVNKSGARMVFHTPFERLHYLKGEFDNLYELINKRRGDATPLKKKLKC